MVVPNSDSMVVMTHRLEMLDRTAPALTPERADIPFNERPSWGARQGGPRPVLQTGLQPSLQPQPERAAGSPPDETALARHWAKLMLDTYSARTSFFPGGLFADPAWDMLLDLMHARLNGKRISVSSLCIAARVPATTALRRIGDLVSTGLAIRMRDETDGRRVFIELTEDGYARMASYLEQVRLAVNRPPAEPRRKV
jgi:hypothetical protein